MATRKLSVETVNRMLRDMYGDQAMFRYKTDGQGNITGCTVGCTDKEGKMYFVKGMSETGDWQACLNMAKKLARDQCYNTIQL